VAGLRDTVVVETEPGRIEVVVLEDPEAAPDAFRARIDAAVRAANAALGANQRIAGWRVWPGEDFPRTHTLKIRRDPVRHWAASNAPLPVTEGD
jgi:long-chain acyl-CoA synthetase